MARTIAIALVVACLVGPAPVASPLATLGGIVLDADRAAPLAGARLLVRAVGSDPVLASDPAGADGAFELADLAPGTYEIAVADRDGSLYVSPGAVTLAGGEHREVAVTVQPSALAPASVWDKPGTTALVLIGIAVVAGIVLNEVFGSSSNDDAPISPSTY